MKQVKQVEEIEEMEEKVDTGALKIYKGRRRRSQPWKSEEDKRKTRGETY